MPGAKNTSLALAQLMGLYRRSPSGSILLVTIFVVMSIASGPSLAFVSRPAWGTVVDFGPTIYNDGEINSKPIA